MKKQEWFIFSILFVIIGGVLWIYFSKFHNGLSGNSNDWGNFGDYIGGIGGLVLSFALLWFTYRADKREEAAYTREKEVKKREERLLFSNELESISRKIKEYDSIVREKSIVNMAISGSHLQVELDSQLNDLKKEIVKDSQKLENLAEIYGFVTSKFDLNDIQNAKNYIRHLKEQIYN